MDVFSDHNEHSNRGMRTRCFFTILEAALNYTSLAQLREMKRCSPSVKNYLYWSSHG